MWSDGLPPCVGRFVRVWFLQVPHTDPIAMVDVFDGTPPDSLRGSSLISLHVVTILTEGSVKLPSGVTVNAGDVIHSSGGGRKGGCSAVGYSLTTRITHLVEPSHPLRARVAVVPMQVASTFLALLRKVREPAGEGNRCLRGGGGGVRREQVSTA